MALLSPCTNCKKVNCLKGEPLTTAWEGLTVVQTRDIRSVDFPDHQTQNWSGRVLRYSEDGFTQYNPDTKRTDTGRLLVQYVGYTSFLYTSLDGFVYACQQG